MGFVVASPVSLIMKQEGGRKWQDLYRVTMDVPGGTFFLDVSDRITGHLPSGNIDLAVDEYKKSRRETGFSVHGEMLGGEVQYTMDPYGYPPYVTSYHIKGKVPDGDIDMEMADSGKLRWGNTFALSGTVAGKAVELSIKNTGLVYSHQFNMVGKAFGDEVKLEATLERKRKSPPTYLVSGTAPMAFLTSPIFFPLMMAIIKISQDPIYAEARQGPALGIKM